MGSASGGQLPELQEYAPESPGTDQGTKLPALAMLTPEQEANEARPFRPPPTPERKVRSAAAPFSGQNVARYVPLNGKRSLTPLRYMGTPIGHDGGRIHGDTVPPSEVRLGIPEAQGGPGLQRRLSSDSLAASCMKTERAALRCACGAGER